LVLAGAGLVVVVSDRMGYLLGGFASKMGLASGPAIAALLFGKDNYPLIIAVAVAALVVSLLVIIPPARIQDRPVA
jgi:hypothetical protein